MGKKKEGSQARTRTRVWKKETGKGLQVSNSQTTQVPEPRGVRLEAGPAQGPGPATAQKHPRQPAHRSRATHNTHDPTFPHAIQLPRCAQCSALVVFLLKRPVRRAFAAPPRCTAAQWGGGGVGRRLTLTVALIEACSIDSQRARP
jgi:hypothetical protein